MSPTHPLYPLSGREAREILLRKARRAFALREAAEPRRIRIDAERALTGAPLTRSARRRLRGLGFELA